MTRATLLPFALLASVSAVAFARQAAAETVRREWSPVYEGFSLKAELVPEQIKPGASATLRLTLRNVTDRPLTSWESYPEYDYTLAVKDLRTCKLLKALRVTRSVWRRVVMTVQPGENLAANYRLNWMYKLDAVGEYEIIARRYVPRLKGEGTVQIESLPVVVLRVSDKPTSPIAPQPVEPQPPVNDAWYDLLCGVSLSAYLPRASVASGALGVIELTFRNGSNRGVVLDEYPPDESQYRLLITDEQGRFVPPPNPDWSWSPRSRVVQSGEEARAVYQLGIQGYKLAPGTYTIKAKRLVQLEESPPAAWVTSNPVTLTVRRDQPPEG